MRRKRSAARIGVVYVVPDLEVGGAERHVTTLMPRLDSDSFEPSVICLGAAGVLFPDLVAAGVPAKALGRSKRQALRALIELTCELRRSAPAVVITRGYSAETIGRVAAVLARVPHSVVWVHNCDHIGPRSRLRGAVDWVLGHRTDRYLGVAEAQRRYMSDDLGIAEEKIRIIRNGVEPADFASTDGAGVRAELGLAGDSLVVGIVAALRPEKDHELFLRAARRVRDVVPEARFLLVGDGDLRAELAGLAERLGLAQDVVFAGARADVPAVLDALNLFVLSSSTECFPMALLEAMAAGVPAVCTAVGDVPEMVEEGVSGYIVPPHDPELLADRIIGLLSSPELRAQCGAAARDKVQREFTLERSVQQTEQELTALARTPIRLDLVLDEVSVGGAEQVMRDVLAHFDPQVVSARLICLRRGGPLVQEFRDAGVQVEVLGRRGWWDPWTLAQLWRLMRRRGTDAVLVTHHHRAALALGRVAALLARVPVNVIAVHDMDLAAVGKRCLPRWAVNTLALSDVMILLSASQGEYLRNQEGVGRSRRSSIREVVVPNGIVLPPTWGPADRDRARAELSWDSNPLSDDEFVVGIVARLSAQKAHQVLFAAFARLLDTVPTARLVVVGTGPREAELRSLAAGLGIASRTDFMGVRRDVPELLPGFDVACLSSVHEGVPIAIIEAMAAGLPVVATDCGAVRDLVSEDQTGFLVPVGDAMALAERLARLAGDPGLRAILGANARAVAERDFSVSATARGYEQLLTDLMEAR